MRLFFTLFILAACILLFITPMIKLKKSHKIVVIKIVIYYCLLLGLLYAFQNMVLYAPSKLLKAPANWGLVQNDKKKTLGLEFKVKNCNGTIASTSSGEKSPPSQSPAPFVNCENAPIVIVFPGNAGNALDRSYYKGVLPNTHLIIAEYPGYGLRYNETANKTNIVASAQELVQVVKKTYPNTPIVLLGESLGTGVASEVAAKEKTERLVLITPYTSIADVAQDKFWYFPVQYLVNDNYSNVASLESYTGKVLVLISEQDEVIPPKFGQTLFDKIKAQKEKLLIKGAGHNSWSIQMTAQDQQKLRDFVKNKSY